MEAFLTLLTILGGIVFALFALVVLMVIFLFTVCKFSLWQMERERKKRLANLYKQRRSDSLFD